MWLWDALGSLQLVCEGHQILSGGCVSTHTELSHPNVNTLSFPSLKSNPSPFCSTSGWSEVNRSVGDEASFELLWENSLSQ